MQKPKLVLLDDGYRLEIGDASSEVADYGSPVVLEHAGITYLAYAELEENGEMTTPLDEWVYMVSGSVEPEIVEEEEEETEQVIVEPGGDEHPAAD